MTETRRVVLIVDTTRHYYRKIIVGVASYMHAVYGEGTRGGWSLYVEDNPQEMMPDVHDSRVDGVISTFHDKKISATISQIQVPVVGIEGDYGWRDPDSHIPYFATDNKAIGRMGAKALIDRRDTPRISPSIAPVVQVRIPIPYIRMAKEKRKTG